MYKLWHILQPCQNSVKKFGTYVLSGSGDSSPKMVLFTVANHVQDSKLTLLNT